MACCEDVRARQGARGSRAASRQSRGRAAGSRGRRYEPASVGLLRIVISFGRYMGLLSRLARTAFATYTIYARPWHTQALVDSCGAGRPGPRLSRRHRVRHLYARTEGAIAERGGLDVLVAGVRSIRTIPYRVSPAHCFDDAHWWGSGNNHRQRKATRYQQGSGWRGWRRLTITCAALQWRLRKSAGRAGTAVRHGAVAVLVYAQPPRRGSRLGRAHPGTRRRSAAVPTRPRPVGCRPPDPVPTGLHASGPTMTA